MQQMKRIVLWSFAVALLLLAAFVVRHALLLIYVSCIFAVVLTPAVNYIHGLKIGGWRPSRGAAILLIALAAGAVALLIALFAFPPLFSQAREFLRQLPALVGRLRSRFSSVPVLSEIDPNALSGYLTSHAKTIASLFATLAGAIVSAVTIFVLTAYLILDGKRAFQWFISLFPPDSAQRLEPALRRAGYRMRRWLTGQAMLMLILGSASAVAFGAMRIPFFYLLALFAGAANIIPFLGPILTVVLASLFAVVDSPWKVLGVLIFYLVYQQVENAFLTPRIMQAQVKLSPAAVLAALVIGEELAGILGALVAVPTAVLCSVLLDEYVVHDGQAQEAHTGGRRKAER